MERHKVITFVVTNVFVCIWFQQKAIVFPLSHYEDFLTLLLNNPSQCIEIFEKTAVKEERDKVAEALVKVYEARNQYPPFSLSFSLSIEW